MYSNDGKFDNKCYQTNWTNVTYNKLKTEVILLFRVEQIEH